MSRYFSSAFLIFAAMFYGCKKQFAPQITKSGSSYLVVEGTIISSGDSTKIRISRTRNIADTTTINPEVGANVSVESDQSAVYKLNGDKSGNYTSAPLNLNVSNKYRVKIITQGKTSVSDFEPVKITPPIDSVGFTIRDNGLQVYANAHDATNNTRYYRWDYV